MRYVHQLKIGTRLRSAFGLLLLILLALGSTGYWASAQLFAEVETIYEDRTVPLGHLSQIDYLLQRNRVLVMDALIQPGSDVVQSRLDELRGNKQTMDRLWSDYTAQPLSPDEQRLAQAYAQARAAYENDALAPAAEALRRGDTAGALALYLDQATRLAPPTVEAMKALLKHQVDQAAREYAISGSVDRSVRLIMMAGTLGALLAGFWLALLITQSIVTPLRRAVQVAETVASGDLTSRIEAEGRDETADLLRALARMNDSLVRIVSQVRQASDSIATGSAQIAVGNADLSQRTEEQAANLEETAASMEQLTVTVKQNADTSREASLIATSAREAATRGGAVVEQVVATMQDINQSSQKIADIIAVIDGIAFQTNILALNAAVEAARAGEQGRGFAVVAGEVRTLAQRSAAAAKEIKDLITGSVERVQAGSMLVGQAGDSVREIVHEVKRVAELIGEITAASHEQAGGVSQVGEAVQQLDQVTQQNAALVEESAAAAESLKHQARTLTELVGLFRLAPDAAAVPIATLDETAAPRPLATIAPKAPAVVRPSRQRPANPISGLPVAAAKALLPKQPKLRDAHGVEWASF